MLKDYASLEGKGSFRCFRGQQGSSSLKPSLPGPKALRQLVETNILSKQGVTLVSHPSGEVMRQSNPLIPSTALKLVAQGGGMKTQTSGPPSHPHPTELVHYQVPGERASDLSDDQLDLLLGSRTAQGSEHSTLVPSVAEAVPHPA